MKHVLEAGTDAAVLLLFDPHAFPVGFDTLPEDDQNDALFDLSDRGHIVRCNTDGDGMFLAHVFVDESPELRFEDQYGPEHTDDFVVASGTVHLAGIEYAFRDDPVRLRKYPAMGASFTLAPGTYAVTATRRDVPRDEIRTLYVERVPRGDRRVARLLPMLCVVAVVAALVLISMLIALPIGTWARRVLPACVALILAPALFARVPAVRRARATTREIEREVVPILIVMKRKPGTSQ